MAIIYSSSNLDVNFTEIIAFTCRVFSVTCIEQKRKEIILNVFDP